MPGSMTVPPWFGWQAILAVLVLLIVVAVAFFVASAASPDVDGRSEWQAGLDARSQVRRDAFDEPCSFGGYPPGGGTTSHRANVLPAQAGAQEEGVVAQGRLGADRVEHAVEHVVERSVRQSAARRP